MLEFYVVVKVVMWNGSKYFISYICFGEYLWLLRNFIMVIEWRSVFVDECVVDVKVFNMIKKLVDNGDGGDDVILVFIWFNL